MKSSNEKHTVSSLGDPVESKGNLSSSSPLPTSSDKKTLDVDAVSMESRRAMDTSLIAPKKRNSQVSRGHSKSSLPRAESRTSPGSKTTRVQQTTTLTRSNSSNKGSKAQEIPPPIYTSSVKSRIAGRSTEIPMHLLRSGKNIVTKTITKRTNENGVTEIHITTVTRKLVDNVPSPDSTNRTVVLRTVKKGVSPTSNIDIRARPAVDLAFPLEETDNVNISDKNGTVPTSLRNLRPQSISIRTNYREVDFSKPTTNIAVSQSEVVSGGNKVVAGETRTVNIGTDNIESSKIKTTTTMLQTDSLVTKAPRVTLPANFRRKVAVRGKAYEGLVQIPVASTTGVKSNLQNDVQRDISASVAKTISIETRSRELVKTEQSNVPIKAKSDADATIVQSRIKLTDDTRGIEKPVATTDKPKSQTKTITEDKIKRQKDKLKDEQLQGESNMGKVVRPTKTSQEESSVKNSLKASTRNKTTREPTTKNLISKADTQKVVKQQKVNPQINQRSRSDFSLTNAGSSRKQSTRRRKPPRPKTKLSVEKKISTTTESKPTPPTPATNNLPGTLS